MASFELSRAADRDLIGIYVYSYKTFGRKQAETYLASLEQCFARLAEAPETGRSISTFVPVIAAIITCGM